MYRAASFLLLFLGLLIRWILILCTECRESLIELSIPWLNGSSWTELVVDVSSLSSSSLSRQFSRSSSTEEVRYWRIHSTTSVNVNAHCLRISVTRLWSATMYNWSNRRNLKFSINVVISLLGPFLILSVRRTGTVPLCPSKSKMVKEDLIENSGNSASLSYCDS